MTPTLVDRISVVVVYQVLKKTNKMNTAPLIFSLQ